MNGPLRGSGSLNTAPKERFSPGAPGGRKGAMSSSGRMASIGSALGSRATKMMLSMAAAGAPASFNGEEGEDLDLDDLDGEHGGIRSSYQQAAEVGNSCRGSRRNPEKPEQQQTGHPSAYLGQTKKTHAHKKYV